MGEIKFTKNELRDQQARLAQLNRYLPTLQLKKAMLQQQAQEVRAEVQRLQADLDQRLEAARSFAPLLSEYGGVDPSRLAAILSVEKHYENIAGVEIPFYDGVTFEEVHYRLFDTPPWLDSVFALLRTLGEVKVKVNIAEEKQRAVEKELRAVSIRVNLFEKVLIPRAMENIKKIKVFLGDELLAAVSRAKVAKKKILLRQGGENA